jgi:hypothetical protein
MSLLFTAVGGMMDIMNKEKILGISKTHLFHDSLILLLLAIFTKL